MPEKFKYDVFLSHSPKDKDVVRELAERLAVNGIHVWLMEWQPSADHMDSSKLELALRESKTLLPVMTQNSFGSDWRIIERHIAIFRSIEGSEHRLIPILLENCHIPEELAKLLYVDMRLGDRKQFDSLLLTISLLSDNKSNGEDEHPAPHRLKTISNKITKFNPVAITENGALIAYRLQHNNIRILSRKTGRPSVSLPMPWGFPLRPLPSLQTGSG
jgi:hypothetical protein